MKYFDKNTTDTKIQKQRLSKQNLVKINHLYENKRLINNDYREFVKQNNHSRAVFKKVLICVYI